MSFQNIKYVFVCSLLWANFSWAGAVSGGGGGTLPAEEVDEKYLVDAVVKSRSVIDAFLKDIEGNLILFGNESPDLFVHAFEKLFKKDHDIFELLPKVQIEINRNGPCFDFEGNPVDGSVKSRFENGICMSLPKLKEKLTYANYQGEIAALVLHEISHLMGADENEATTMQKYSIRFFTSTTPSDIFNWNYRMMQSVDSLRANTEIMVQLLKSGGMPTCKQIDTLSDSYLFQLHDLGDGGRGMFLTRERDTEYYWQISTRLIALRDFLCSKPGIGDEFEVKRYTKRYASGFKDGDRVSAYSYFNSTVEDGRPSFNRYPLVTVWIERHLSILDAIAALETSLIDLNNLDELLTSQWDQEFHLLN